MKVMNGETKEQCSVLYSTECQYWTNKMQRLDWFSKTVCKLKEIYLVSIVWEQSNVYECKNIVEQECIRPIHSWWIDFWQACQGHSMRKKQSLLTNGTSTEYLHAKGWS